MSRVYLFAWRFMVVLAIAMAGAHAASRNLKDFAISVAVALVFWHKADQHDAVRGGNTR